MRKEARNYQVRRDAVREKGRVREEGDVSLAAPLPWALPPPIANSEMWRRVGGGRSRPDEETRSEPKDGGVNDVV